MSWLSEDPWYEVGALGLATVACLIALRITQQGKFLLGAGGALGLALLVVKRLWVTDAERVEAFVVALGRAVGRSDPDAVLALLAPDVSLSLGGATIGSPQVQALKRFVPGVDPGQPNPARVLIRETLKSTRFDFLTVRCIRAQAGRLSRMGKADFRVDAADRFDAGPVTDNFATGAGGSDWSLGVREEGSRWLVERITATRLPPGFRIPGLGRGP